MRPKLTNRGAIVPVAILGAVAAVSQVAGLAVAFAAQATNSGAINVTFVFTASAASVVVSVMAWIVKSVFAGRIVPMPINELALAQKALNEKLDSALEAEKGRAGRLEGVLKSATDVIAVNNAYLQRNTTSQMTPRANGGTTGTGVA